MSLPEGYGVRAATPADAVSIAMQRGQMFVDMGHLTPAGAERHQSLWTAWFRDALASGEYAGFLAEQGEDVVGGVGLMFFPKVPTLADPATRKAHVLNMSVDSAHRRRGLAEVLMRAALAEAQARGLRSLTLNAAPMGRRLYERLGFTEAKAPEMRLTLRSGQASSPVAEVL